MKRITSALFLLFTVNAFAMSIPTYDEYELISYPETKSFVDALETDIKTRNLKCTINGEALLRGPFNSFIATISNRLSLIYSEKNDISKLYLNEGNTPALIISSQFDNRDRTRMFDEMKFYLSTDSTAVIRIDFHLYNVVNKKVNEGTIREPRMVTKDILELKSNIKCLLK